MRHQRLDHRPLPITQLSTSAQPFKIPHRTPQTWETRPSPRYLGPVQKLARTRLERQVRDPQVRATLTSDYEIGCKRTLISSN